MSDDQMCPEYNWQVGSRCILPEGHEGKHRSMAYPYDSAPRAWDWENGTPPRDLTEKKLGT